MKRYVEGFMCRRSPRRTQQRRDRVGYFWRVVRTGTVVAGSDR